MATTARIGRTIADSTPAFEPPRRPAPGSPNVVVVVLDDTGYAQLGCFGSDIATPAMDGLAGGGLRYRNFHVTALCSPTRACLLTGRNHHRVGMGFLTDIPIGFPGYNGRIPRSAAALPRLLRDVGYSTMAVGKWHLAPRWEQSASGPFDLWPLGLGFERYYGFLAGDANQWAPELVSDNHFVDPPRTPDEGYHLTEDLADAAIRMVQDQQHATPDKPFFLYFATGAMHAPHHAPADWIDRYRGHFDDGWEQWRARAFDRQVELGVVPPGTTLTTRPSWVAPWDSLPVDERRVYSRMMEVFAGFLSHTDAQLARIVAFLERQGILDDTLILLLSDNGTSAEGGPQGSYNEHRFTHDMTDELAVLVDRLDDLGGTRAYNHYAWGWAWAGNAPFRLWKRYTWLGGVRTPLVAHWPRGIERGDAVGPAAGVRPQFSHAVDVFATVLDVAGVDVPEAVDGVSQLSVDGRSLVPTFTDAEAPAPRDTQYFEMLGSRAIYHGGWKATTDHVGKQLSIERELVEGSHDFDEDRWALFHVDEDFAEHDDVAAEHPQRLRHLTDLWWAEAGRNQVLPLDDSLIGRAIAIEPSPEGPVSRRTYRPGGGPVQEDLLPALGGGFGIVATFEAADGWTPEGIICALGDWNNGFALYVLEGRPVLCINLFGDAHRFVGTTVVGDGAHRLVAEYRREAPRGGAVRLFLDGEPASEEGRLPTDLPFRWQIGGAGLRIGRDSGLPVCDDYRPPFPLHGTIDTVEIISLALAPRDLDAEIAAELRHE